LNPNIDCEDKKIMWYIPTGVKDPIMSYLLELITVN